MINSMEHLLIIPFESLFIVFNRTNGAISLLTPQEINMLKENTCKTDLLQSFGDKSFVRENVSLYKEYDNFLVTIELSTLCNLACLYCYQDKIYVREEIEENVINAILVYIEEVFLTEKRINYLVIGLIGGEPMLHKDVALSLIEKIVCLCHQYGKLYTFHIDTNGTIPLEEIDERFDNVKFSVSLSEQKDHNALRGSSNFNSFQQIVENLRKLKNSKNRLGIRCNVNHNNINSFGEFVIYVKENIPNVNNIDPMFLDNYDKNKLFTNKLSQKEFSKWNSTTAIDILIENGFIITGGVSSVLQLCAAYQPYSCKVHASGFVTLCDSMEYKEQLHINELSKDITLLEKCFLEYKNYNPLNSQKCATCKEIIQCQGEIFCRKNYCNYQKRYNEIEFIKTYVKYVLMGKADYFVWMSDE